MRSLGHDADAAYPEGPQRGVGEETGAVGQHLQISERNDQMIRLAGLPNDADGIVLEDNTWGCVWGHGSGVLSLAGWHSGLIACRVWQSKKQRRDPNGTVQMR
ncbi:MAG: hypothetical protein R3E47_10775 [Paracoccaceae bacterium]